MWNDPDIPFGYLITFRCYGTWLHGDERGSVDRYHNRYNSPYLPRSGRRQDLSAQQLRSARVSLDAARRQSVETAIREVCEYRQWSLHAINVRTNHVHTVVSTGGAKPDRALNAFKAYATRRMRQHGHWNESHSLWADRGSKRHLWNERSMAMAMSYVVEGQGEPPDFD